MTKTTVDGIALALLASIQWGATGVWVALLRDLPVGTTLVFRFLSAALLLSLLLFLIRGFRAPTLEAVRAGALLATYYVLATVAFYLSDVVSVSLLIATSPFFVLLLRALRRERIAAREGLGGTLAFAGVALVMVLGAHHGGAGRAASMGDLCALGAAATMAVYSLAGTRLHGQGASVVLIACLLGLLVCVPFATPAQAVPDARQWGLFLGLAAFSTLAPGYLYPLACQRISPTTATTVRLSTPFFAALFAWLVLAQTLTVGQWLGAPLIVLGIYLTLGLTAARNTAGR